jgi:predicted  nucleic acid-binding Zn-ribbon protein
MKYRYSSFAVMVLLAVSVAWGQGKGQGSQAPKGQGQKQQQAGAQQGQGDMEGDRVRATARQRDQLQTCDRSAEGIRTRTRQMAKTAGGKGFSPDQARKEQSQVREQLAKMNQEHERLMQGLNDGQRRALQAHITNMERSRERINTQLQGMDQELSRPQPEGRKVAEQAREMERAMNEWQKQYRAVQSRLVVEP